MPPAALVTRISLRCTSTNSSKACLTLARKAELSAVRSSTRTSATDCASVFNPVSCAVLVMTRLSKKTAFSERDFRTWPFCCISSMLLAISALIWLAWRKRWRISS